ERDGSVDAVEHLLIGVAVRRVAVARPLRPGVTAGRFAAQSLHQFVLQPPACHAPDSKIAWMKPRFVADCNVGRLARWLRALGYDASYHAHIEDAALVREAAAEGRVLLTRDRDLTKRRVIQSCAGSRRASSPRTRRLTSCAASSSRTSPDAHASTSGATCDAGFPRSCWLLARPPRRRRAWS